MTQSAPGHLKMAQPSVCHPDDLSEAMGGGTSDSFASREAGTGLRDARQRLLNLMLTTCYKLHYDDDSLSSETKPRLAYDNSQLHPRTKKYF